MATSFKMDKGWKKWEYAITPRVFAAKLNHNMRRATALNGKIAEATIRNTIKAGVDPANANLTIMIKSSSKPLVDKPGGLFQAVTSVVVDHTTVFAGVLSTDGDYDIAIALHEGATIAVTPRMRGMFFWLWHASEGRIQPVDLDGRAAELWERAPGGWVPLKESTTHIVIPSRPFIQKAFADKEMREKAKHNWQMALQVTMRELAKGRQ